MIFVLDNYDSFTYNLVQLVGALGANPVVHRNDAVTVAQVLALGPGAIIISPGPCTPAEAGISMALARAAAERGVPLLGVCLGHQALAAAFGATVGRAPRLMHGKTCTIRHGSSRLFDGIPSPFTVMRYHSLVVDAATLPAEFEVTADVAAADENTVMAVAHRTLPLFGVQFHPESAGTDHGRRLIENFLTLAS